jgi:hypothetical protein
MSVYRVVSGVSSIRSDEEAQVVGEELERRFGDRPIVASEVVALARRARSPLHRHFEWDDGVAGEAYRELQARSLLRSIAVVRSDVKGRDRNTRAYFNVALLTDVGVRRAYVAERIVWATPELADQVVVRAERELLGWRTRYSDYQELRAAGALVDEAIAVLEAGKA